MEEVTMHLGPGEIALLIILALVLFGAKRLPQVGKAAGEAIREFKSAFYGRKSGDGNEGGGGSGVVDGAPGAPAANDAAADNAAKNNGAS
jgi:sec-independent protein translocase protein TatA